MPIQIDMKTARKTWLWHTGWSFPLLYAVDGFGPFLWEYTSVWEAWRIVAAFWFLREVDQVVRKLVRAWNKESVFKLAGRSWRQRLKNVIKNWVRDTGWIDVVGDFMVPDLVSFVYVALVMA